MFPATLPVVPSWARMPSFRPQNAPGPVGRMSLPVMLTAWALLARIPVESSQKLWLVPSSGRTLKPCTVTLSTPLMVTR